MKKKKVVIVIIVKKKLKILKKVFQVRILIAVKVSILKTKKIIIMTKKTKKLI